MKNWKRNITLFLSSQTISLLGSALVQYAITWHITLETESGLMMTFAIICGFLPTFFILPFAGVWADRYDKRKLIAFADALIATVTAVVAVAWMLGYQQLWLLFAAMAVRGLGQGIQQPAVGALLPQLVPQDKLMKVNSANSTIQSILSLVAPLAAAGLLGIAPLHYTFLIDIVTAAAAIFILLVFVEAERAERVDGSQPVSYFSDMREGLRYVFNHSFLKQLFLFCIIFFLMASAPAFLSPLQLKRNFGGDTFYLSLLEISFAGGMLLGGLVMMTWGGFKNRLYSLALALGLFAVGTMLLGVTSVLWLYFGLMVLLGLSMPLFNVPFSVTLQQSIEPEYLGRVFGILGMISSLGMPVGILAFGPLADIINLDYIMMFTGAVMFVASLFMLRNKTLLKAGEPPLAPPDIEHPGLDQAQL